jgi:hypothetical protein
VSDEVSGASRDASDSGAVADVRERRQRPHTITCPWCDTTIVVKARGRTPKWCSDTCRHRAWEQQRAAESGRSAVQIVERPVVIQHTTRIPAANPAREVEWADTLAQLTRLVDSGRVYDRDLRPIAEAAVALNNSLERRLQRRNRRQRYFR